MSLPLTWGLIFIVAVALDVLLLWWLRGRSSGNPARPQVRVWGVYSPILTWLKYRTGSPVPTPTVGIVSGDLPAESAVLPFDAQETELMSASESTPSPTPPVEAEPVAAPAPATARPPAPPPPPGSAPVANPTGWNLALAFGALVLALVGQFFFANIRENLKDGGLFFAGAIALLLILVWRQEPRRTFSARATFGPLLEKVRNQPVRTALVLASVALIYTTLRLMQVKPGGASYWDVFTLWVLAAVCYGAAFIPPPRLAEVRSRLRRNQGEVLLIVGLTVVAAILRFWQLGARPDIVSGDEGIIGTAIMSVLDGQVQNLMVTSNNQGVLYLYILAGAVKLFGQNALGLRVVAAVAGTMSIPLLYILARHMFNFRIALMAAALLAVSHFDIHLSRVIVASSIYDALFAVVVFYLLLAGLEKRSLTHLVLGGLLLGFFLYIYMGARLLVLVIPAYLLVLWFIDKSIVRDNVGGLLAFAGGLALVATPLTVWAIANPAEFMSRINQMGVIQTGWLATTAADTGRSQLVVLADLLRQAFLTVNYYPATVHYNSLYPMLDFVSGALFILGLAYSLYHVFDRRHLLLQAWFWSGVLVGGALVLVPSDNAYRIAIVFPAVCIFVALGVDRLASLGNLIIPGQRWTMLAPVIVFITVATVLNLKAYFPDFAFTCRYADWATRFASHMGYKLASVGPSYSAYLVGDGNVWHGIHPSVDYLTNRIPLTNVAGLDDSSGELVITQPEGPVFVMPENQRTIVFFIPSRAEDMATIRAHIPGGDDYYISDCGLPMVGVYQVDDPLTP